MPDIIESNDYESPALFWMYREIKRLNETLVAAGMADEDTRREVCEHFFFGIQEGLTTPVTAMDDQRFTPLLTLIVDDGRYLRATDQFDFHEMHTRSWPSTSRTLTRNDTAIAERTLGRMSEPSVSDGPASLFELSDDGLALPTGFARGPWDPRALHGGPVAALLAYAVEQAPSDDVDWFVTRLTIDLERPVPLEPLRFQSEVTRPGRKVSIVEATVTHAESGAVLARARALRIRTADVALPVHDPALAPLLAIEPPPPGPEHGHAGRRWSRRRRHRVPQRRHRAPVRRRIGHEPGPVVDWIRLCVPVFPDVRADTVAARRRCRGLRQRGVASASVGVVPVRQPGSDHSHVPAAAWRVGRYGERDAPRRPGNRHVGHAVFDVDGRIGRSCQSLFLDRL